MLPAVLDMCSGTPRLRSDQSALSPVVPARGLSADSRPSSLAADAGGRNWKIHHLPTCSFFMGVSMCFHNGGSPSHHGFNTKTPSILHDLGYRISLFGTPPDNHSMNIGRFTPRQNNIDEKNK